MPEINKKLLVNLITEDDLNRDITPPSVPSQPTAISDEYGNINITFTGSTDTETGVGYYTVYRSSSTSSFVPVSRITHNEELEEYTLTDIIVNKNIKYYYVVSATDKAGNESKMSDETEVTSKVSVAPPKSESISAAAIDENTIRVSWSTPTVSREEQTISKYILEVSRDEGENWSHVITTSDTSYLYLFDRSVDAYPEAEDLENYKFRVKTVSVYDNSSEYTVSTGLDTSNYKGWTPEVDLSYIEFHPYEEAIEAKDTKDHSEESYGDFITYFKIKENTFTDLYRFIRGEGGDGYPEPAELLRYEIEVWVKNKVSNKESEHRVTSIKSSEMYDYYTFIPTLEPTSISIFVHKDGIELNDIRNYSVTAMGRGFKTEYSISKDSGTTWSNYFSGNYFFDRPNGEYPEFTDLLGYRIKYKVTNTTSGSVAEYNGVLYITQEMLKNYGTWKLGTLSVKAEAVDKTAFVSVDVSRADTAREYYGFTEYAIRIRRIGNEEIINGITFNELLGITPDTEFYKVNTTGDYSSEDFYRDGLNQEFYFFTGNKYVQTLPLIGHSSRLYRNNAYIGKNKNDAINANKLPQPGDPNPPSEGDLYCVEGRYYQYIDSIWVSISEYNYVETQYEFEVYATNEMYKYLYKDREEDIPKVTRKVTALPTSISDVVHAHEHYKSLYVENLSAINANIGLITQGGMGDFSSLSNYWALSDLTPEESSTGTGVKKGAFRVGGEDEFIKVEPRDDGSYSVEVHAGDITLSSSGTSFRSGTYIYDKNDNNKRMKLTSEGIVIQSKEPSLDWEKSPITEIGSLTIDANGNLMLSNTSSQDENAPQYGIYVNGSKVYHFNNSIKDQSGADPAAINTGMSTSNLVNLDDPFVPGMCYGGSITKKLNSVSGKYGFLNRSDFITIGNHTINDNGDVDAKLNTLNQYYGITAFKWKV